MLWLVPTAVLCDVLDQHLENELRLTWSSRIVPRRRCYWLKKTASPVGQLRDGSASMGHFDEVLFLQWGEAVMNCLVMSGPL